MARVCEESESQVGKAVWGDRGRRHEVKRTWGRSEENGDVKAAPGVRGVGGGRTQSGPNEKAEGWVSHGAES